MNKDQAEEVRKRKNLSPKEKFQIFIDATMAKAEGNGGIAKILRRWDIHASDLTRIRQTVEEGAINNFKARKSRKPMIDQTQYEELKTEKQRLEATVIEQAAELALLKKKDRSA